MPKRKANQGRAHLKGHEAAADLRRGWGVGGGRGGDKRKTGKLVQLRKSDYFREIRVKIGSI